MTRATGWNGKETKERFFAMLRMILFPYLCKTRKIKH